MADPGAQSRQLQEKSPTKAWLVLVVNGITARDVSNTILLNFKLSADFEALSLCIACDLLIRLLKFHHHH